MSSTDVSNRDSGFVRFIIHYYRKWGYFISKHDWKAILIVLVISSLFNLKVLTTKQKNDITGNADYDARSRIEYEKYKEFFASNGWGVATYVFLLAKDDGSMIRERYLNETLQNGLQFQSNLAKNGEPYSTEINLTYPISKIFGREVNLMQNFFGAEFDKSRKNGSMEISEMNMVKMVVFQLRAEQKDGWTEDDVRKYEMDVVKFLNDTYKSENLNIYVLSKTYVEDEMVRATNSSMPYLSLGFLVMCICSVISVLISASYMHQRNYMKIVLAVLACVLPFMSCATAMGILFLCGVRFASILVVIPFLVLAIAVDSSYLLIHEWQHVVQRCREHPGPQTSDVGYRLSEVLAEVGPSILISALTNIFADFIGLFTSSEEITILCFGTLVAMVVAFVYQMTFYIGLMSRMGRREIANEEKETPHINGNTFKSQAKAEHFITKIIQGYVNFLSNKIVALTVLGIYVLYIVFSILGITQININLTTQKLFALDSPLIELDKLRVDYQVPQYSMATVFVSNLGNLSDTKLQDIGSLVNSLENLKGSWGTVGTRFFLREFLSYENSLEGNELDTIPKEDIVKKLSKLYNPDDLRSFITWPEYTYYRGFIKFKDDTNELDRFFFTTAYHGENLKIWAERAKMLNQWRDTIDNYSSKFDVSVFHEDGIFLDLIEYMPTNTFQSVLGILVCMAIICLIFLKSFFTVIISSAAVLSIFTGLLGSLSYLNMDLDPITMAAMIIALGYSVDIPAHISFHYHQAGYHEINPTPQKRLVKTFSSVAFPVIQAGLSTCICVCSLLFIRLYMAQVFVKSTVLTVFLCNLHGLVFLPVFIILFNWILERHGKSNKVQDNNNHLDTFKTTASTIGSP